MFVLLTQWRYHRPALSYWYTALSYAAFSRSKKGKSNFLKTHFLIFWCFLHMQLIALYHYCDFKMGAVASQITSLMIVYSTVYSDANKRKHQSSMSLAFVRGIHRGPVQVMAWCRQATTHYLSQCCLSQCCQCCLTAPSHYLSQCWPRSLSPYGVTRPQWVESLRPVMHICSPNSGHHWFKKWLAACSLPIHYLSHYWLMVNWPLVNTFHWY